MHRLTANTEIVRLMEVVLLDNALIAEVVDVCSANIIANIHLITATHLQQSIRFMGVVLSIPNIIPRNGMALVAVTIGRWHRWFTNQPTPLNWVSTINMFLTGALSPIDCLSDQFLPNGTSLRHP